VYSLESPLKATLLFPFFKFKNLFDHWDWFLGMFVLIYPDSLPCIALELFSHSERSIKKNMNIWIDGDACPKAIKEILFRAALKRKIMVIIVANHLATTPSSSFIKRVQVESGFDKADQYIIAHIIPSDLVITADIILADHVITKNAIALNPRGMLYTSNNMKHILAMRHLHESLRESGLIFGGVNALTSKEIQIFSHHLDKIITSLQL
jgi:uncharacterized protein YaiI (UPF0178 family)